MPSAVRGAPLEAAASDRCTFSFHGRLARSCVARSWKKENSHILEHYAFRGVLTAVVAQAFERLPERSSCAAPADVLADNMPPIAGGSFHQIQRFKQRPEPLDVRVIGLCRVLPAVHEDNDASRFVGLLNQVSKFTDEEIGLATRLAVGVPPGKRPALIVELAEVQPVGRGVFPDAVHTLGGHLPVRIGVCRRVVFRGRAWRDACVIPSEGTSVR